MAGYRIAGSLLGRAVMGGKRGIQGAKTGMSAIRGAMTAAPGGFARAVMTSQTMAFTAGGGAMAAATGDPGWIGVGFGMGMARSLTGKNLWGSGRLAIGIGAGVLAQNPLAVPIAAGALGGMKMGFKSAMGGQTGGQYWGSIGKDVGRYYKGSFQALTGQSRKSFSTWASVQNPYFMGPLAWGATLAAPAMAMNLAMPSPTQTDGVFPGGVGYATPGGQGIGNHLNTTGLTLAMHKNRHGGSRII